MKTLSPRSKGTCELSPKRADAFSLFARFETKLEQHNGKLDRAVVELAKD